MRRTLLIGPLFMLALAACQDSTDGARAQAAPAIRPSVTTAPDAACERTTPTVVRYRSRFDARTQHSVHLLNETAATPRRAACEAPLPIAGVVTLRYRLAGS